jgi:hypothetical protein
MIDVPVASWLAIYRRCRSIYEMGGNFRSLVTAQEPAEAFRSRCSAYRAAGVPVTEEIENLLLQTRQRVAAERRGRHFQDVYHAATDILLFPTLTYQPRALKSEDPEMYPYVHRGQRDSRWQVSPNILRIQAGEASTPAPDLIRSRLRRTGAFVRSLRNKRPDLDERHAAAVAQHFSFEANVKTWLTDMTTDPFVALWFASRGGKSGDTGIVETIPLKEWNDLADGDGALLGPLRLLYPDGIHRIQAQHGVFLEAPSAVFWSQYIKQSLTFDQRNGLVFEDDTIGVTEEDLMPENDEILRFARSFAEDRSVSGEALECEDEIVNRLTIDFRSSQPYSGLGRRIAAQWADPMSPYLAAQIEAIARFHAATLRRPWPEEIWRGGLWSILRFKEAVEFAAINAAAGKSESWQQIVERTSGCPPGEFPRFRIAQEQSQSGA